MNQGWVKLWRKSLDGGMLKNPKLWTFWSWCLVKASHKEHKQTVGLQEVTLQPGQFIFGRRAAAREIGLTEREIRTIIDRLKTRQNIALKPTNKFTIVSIVNWNTYQGREDDERPSKRPASDPQVTTNKNVENEKIEYVRHHGDEKVTMEEAVEEVLQVFNQYRCQLLGRTNIRPVNSDKLIRARLKAGGTVHECCRIIAVKAADEHFRRHPRYFHPDTLFLESHWHKYLDEAELMKDAQPSD